MITVVMPVSAQEDKVNLLIDSIDSLSKCELASCTSIIFGIEPDKTKEKSIQILLKYLKAFKQITFVNNKTILGITENINSLLREAFKVSDRVICIEEGTICSVDALVYFYSMLEKFEDDPTIFTISGSGTSEEEKKSPKVNEFRFSKQVHSLGWATWFDRWDSMKHKFLFEKQGYPHLLQKWCAEHALINVYPIVPRCSAKISSDNFDRELNSWKFLENGVCLLITNFNRNKLLVHTLNSIERQLPKLLTEKFEVIVLNEGEPKDIEKICDRPFVRLCQTKLDTKIWRTPSIPLNIGAKLTNADILLISGSEIYHMNAVLNSLIDAVARDKKAFGIPFGWDDTVGKEYTNPDVQVSKTKSLNTMLPFLMSLWRETYLKVGGYDEKFSDGVSFDDSDFITKLLKFGCHYVRTQAEIAHLYHPRLHNNASRHNNSKHGEERNRKLYVKKHGNFTR